MKINLIESKKVMFALVASGIFTSICVILYFFHGRYAYSISLGLALFIILTVMSLTYDRLIREINRGREENLYELKNTQKLYEVQNIIRPDKILPATGGFACQPDFLHLVINQILADKSELIVECGPGTSTIYIGYLLKKLGKGKIISFDHDKVFADKTRELVKHHELSEFVEIRHAPLCEYNLDGKNWKWYSLHEQTINNEIDLLIVDGPPGNIQLMARYPALPVLFEKLSKNATIVIDDTKRADDRSAVHRWIKKYPDLKWEEIDVQRGAFILKR
ncbi:MAG TPA: class I SAM-dependent methyltransferase [Cytophagaceae bacterium]|jgi:predicted O-methyltransferase YrrM